MTFSASDVVVKIVWRRIQHQIWLVKIKICFPTKRARFKFSHHSCSFLHHAGRSIRFGIITRRGTSTTRPAPHVRFWGSKQRPAFLPPGMSSIFKNSHPAQLFIQRPLHLLNKRLHGLAELLRRILIACADLDKTAVELVEILLQGLKDLLEYCGVGV